MLGLVLGHKPPPFTLVLIDQTTIDGVEVINAAVPFEGRAVPVAWVDFEYPWKTTRPASQNIVEKLFLTWLTEAAPADTRLLLVLDRGYARVALIQELNRDKQPFLIRGTSKVILHTPVRGRCQRISLGRLPHRTGVPKRYRHALYHANKKEPVDVVVYRGPGFKEPWFLIVPPDSEDWLPTEQVVSLYRQRMQIEHCFRDWKSHLGLRGLQLQVQKPARLLRLLMAFTLAYLFTLLLGQDPLAQKARVFFECPRRHPRHGTHRVLSVLSVALYMMADPQWQSRAWQRLLRILSKLAHHRGVCLAPLPP